MLWQTIQQRFRESPKVRALKTPALFHQKAPSVSVYFATWNKLLELPERLELFCWLPVGFPFIPFWSNSPSLHSHPEFLSLFLGILLAEYSRHSSMKDVQDFPF